MKILFTGGGTCGHLTPAIAMADAVKENDEGSKILFIGRRGGDENRLILSAGYELKEVDIRGLDRESPVKRITDSIRSCRAVLEAGKIIRAFRPDITVGTGGYASFPALAYSTLSRIPTVIHESNAYPGLVTRLFAKKARLVLLGLEGAREHLSEKARVRVVGNPIRGDLEKLDRSEARASLGALGKTVILSVGGSGGAKRINDAAIGLMKGYTANKRSILHIHVTGRGYYESVIKSEADLIKSAPNLKVLPFIEDMPRYLCAADIVISRSGAMTVSELLHVGCPAILIPSPNVTDDHQMKNALEAKRIGDAVVIPETELTDMRLIYEVDRLVRDKGLREAIRDKAHAAYHSPSGAELFKILSECIGTR